MSKWTFTLDGEPRSLEWVEDAWRPMVEGDNPDVDALEDSMIASAQLLLQAIARIRELEDREEDRCYEAMERDR